MNPFAKVIKRRMNYMTAGFIFIIAIFLANRYIPILRSNVVLEHAEMLTGFRMGLIIGVELIMVFVMCKYRKAIRDADYMEDLRINEQDERNKMIQLKTGGHLYNAALFAVAAVTIIASYISWQAYLGLLMALMVMSLIKGVAKVYYRSH